MKITRLLVASAIIINSIPLLATADDWNTKVVGLMVSAPEGSTDNRNFCWKPGVTVSVMLSPAHGSIIKINQNESRLTAFTDDLGTDLMAVQETTDVFNKPGVNFQSCNDQGMSSIILDLKALGHPAAGATRLNISGSVNVQAAGSSKQVTVDDVQIQAGATFNIDDLLIKISEAGENKSQWSSKDYKYSVTFSCRQNMDTIAKFEFFDPQGKKVDAVKRSWGGGPGFGYTIQYDVKQSVDHVKLVATCWQDLKTVDVPISIKTGVGF